MTLRADYLAIFLIYSFSALLAFFNLYFVSSLILEIASAALVASVAFLA
jgi:hypothetical protein